MNKPSKHTRMLIKSLVASKRLIVGGKFEAEGEIQKIVSAISANTNIEDYDSSCMPEQLIRTAVPELSQYVPTIDDIKSWLLYSEDFSGTTFYYNKGREIVFARIVRSLDLSSGAQYIDNKHKAKAYVEALQSGEAQKIEITRSVLQSNLPQGKLKYLHWIGSKPSNETIKKFMAENPLYF